MRWPPHAQPPRVVVGSCDVADGAAPPPPPALLDWAPSPVHPRRGSRGRPSPRPPAPLRGGRRRPPPHAPPSMWGIGPPPLPTAVATAEWCAQRGGNVDPGEGPTTPLTPAPRLAGVAAPPVRNLHATDNSRIREGRGGGCTRANQDERGSSRWPPLGGRRARRRLTHDAPAAPERHR